MDSIRHTPDHGTISPSTTGWCGRTAEVALVFLRLGFTAFGGPAAHVAMMEQELVHRRQWIDRRHFLDLLTAVNFVPGPNSTEMAIHLGLIRAGYPGLFAAGACFITPAMLIILPIAWLYVTYGALPQVQHLLVGINAAMVGIIAVALWRLARTAVHDRFTITVASLATIGAVAAQRWLPQSQPDLIVLSAAAAFGAVWRARAQWSRLPLLSVCPAMIAAADGRVGDVANLLRMAVFFLKVGATLFGSGYVLVSYLQGGLVDQWHWLTQRQLLDAISVGQVTPGPLLTTATFVGFVLGHSRFGGGLAGGVVGAVLATVAIFLPAFVFIALLGRLLPRIRNNPYARGALDATNAAVVALILIVVIKLAMTALSGPLTWLILALVLGAMLRWNVNATWLVGAAAVIGYLGA